MAGKPSRSPADKIPLPLAVANETEQGRGGQGVPRNQQGSGQVAGRRYQKLVLVLVLVSVVQSIRMWSVSEEPPGS
jgi:hypothetical protein